MSFNRRDLLRTLGGAALIGRGLRPNRAFGQVIDSCATQTGLCALGGYIEVFPTSPLILDAFADTDDNQLPIPQPAPPDPSVLTTASGLPGVTGSNYVNRIQDCDLVSHQKMPNELLYNGLPLPDPECYRFQLKVGTHRFTKSKVQQLVDAKDAAGNIIIAAGTVFNGLPDSTIWGFNGTFPGPMIYARYGQPTLVRFENLLGEDNGHDPQDFGAPDRGFLTHLHNGHTAPESDGNPNHKQCAYQPGEWCENLYLNWPAGGDDREKQSFFWFHDHRMDHTGANVYKGMVGLYPIYDPDSGKDAGNEKRGCRLPGVPTFLGSGRGQDTAIDYTKPIKYDIPLVLYDCRLDDGAVAHKDCHNGNGESRPEWWGKTFFRHFPNHGFVGDIFTVNGAAYPVLHVKKRRYRLRFLDASISRDYELMLMSSSLGPQAVPGSQGQYQLPDGVQNMVFTQIASEGGLLDTPIVRNSFQIWPAKRREFIVDFGKHMNGSSTGNGEVMYLVNIMSMQTGRKPDAPAGTPLPPPAIDPFTGLPLPPEDPPPPTAIPNYKVPLVKIIIDSDLPDPDFSIDPLDYSTGTAKIKIGTNGLPVLKLRGLPPVTGQGLKIGAVREFELQRSGHFGNEFEWLINKEIFEPGRQLARPTLGSAEVWTIKNGGGGWVHPLHIHQEEHHVLSRNGVPSPDAAHPDDNSKEDVVALGPSESVTFFRQFRTFTGRYVCHCHQLAHEDHAMMFGWEIVP